MARCGAALMALAVLAAACGPTAEQQRAAAERERQQVQARADLQHCRRDQAAVRQLTEQMQRLTTELTRLNAERYAASPRPEPPDPTLAARFTQDDRDLDELRYRERLQNWEVQEQQRYGRWLDEQRNRRDQLRVQLQTNGTMLRRIAPELLTAPGGTALKPEAVDRASRCDPADFGLQNSEAAGNSSKATAN